ncbi:hypothetical protein K431DRAFT_169958 [Polychaeton citri CBS 116435]|uniref:Uncharacterized protein n=1 Tax=Polychaeton citri CBS 116435 TaxID=1314669 RepID=A0A9P4Q2E1_9PEZI|nr:hypothetical protein K431DRAFT_169958 [Polychaeton citri CBS 116435]
MRRWWCGDGEGGGQPVGASISGVCDLNGCVAGHPQQIPTRSHTKPPRGAGSAAEPAGIASIPSRVGFHSRKASQYCARTFICPPLGAIHAAFLGANSGAKRGQIRGRWRSHKPFLRAHTHRSLASLGPKVSNLDFMIRESCAFCQMDVIRRSGCLGKGSRRRGGVYPRYLVHLPGAVFD